MITPETGNLTLDVDQRFVLRCLARFKFVYCVFPRGWSKCITGDSLLFTDQGIKEIGEYFNYQDDNIETIIDHSVNIINRYGNLENSNKGIYNGYKTTKSIKTSEGYEIEGTLIHPLLTMNKQGELVWKKIKDIQVGDFVTVNRKNDIWGNKTKLDINMDDWINTFFGRNSKWKIEKVKCNIVKELDEDLALIMGYLTGGGCMTKYDDIPLTNSDEDILQNYFSFMENRLGIKVSKRSSSDIDYTTNDMHTGEYFGQLGLKQVDTFDKEIPKCILEAPKNIVTSFVRGLFDVDVDVDDMVDEVRVSVTTASEKLSKQIQTVLLNFGIISSRRKKHNKQFNTDSYYIDIYGKNIDLFYSKIGFSCQKKQKKLLENLSVKRNSNKDIIPYQMERVKSFYTEAEKYNPYLYDKLHHTIKGNNELTYEKLEMLMKLNNSETCSNYSELKEFQELGYFFSKVESVKESKNHVYDLQVPNTNSFIANGIVNHNTFLELMYNFHTCIFYPDIELAMTAQTMENASALVGSKWREIIKFYPLIGHELQCEPKISKDKAVVSFKSGGIIDTLQNGQGAKGQRRKRLAVEEYAQVNDEVFTDCLEPIPNIPRITLGRKGTINPYELNGQILYLTTSWFVGTDSYEKGIIMSKNMIELKGEMVLGSKLFSTCFPCIEIYLKKCGELITMRCNIYA